MDGRIDLLSGSGVGPVDRPMAAGSGGSRDGRGRGRRSVAGITGRTGLPVGGLLDRDWSSARAEPVGDAARIDRGTAKAPATRAAPPVDSYGETRPPFGAWLLAQTDRDGILGELIAGAKRDPLFPKRGDPDEVRERLQKVGADGDMFAAVDTAELDWLSY